MGQVFFVRHGRAMVGEVDYDHLHELGERQARHTAKFLWEQKPNFQRIVSGTLKRQIQTAAIIAEEYEKISGTALPIVHDDSYIEIPLDEIMRIHVRKHVQIDEQLMGLFGGLENGSVKHHDIVRYCFTLWRQGKFDQYGVETYATCKERVERIVASLQHGNSHSHANEKPLDGNADQLVISSLGTICCVLRTLANESLETLDEEVKIANASITCINTGAAGPSVVYENEYSHLIPHEGLVTF